LVSWFLFLVAGWSEWGIPTYREFSIRRIDARLDMRTVKIAPPGGLQCVITGTGVDHF